jgi:hypothetical protein
LILDISIYCISFWAFVESGLEDKQRVRCLYGPGKRALHKVFGFTRKWIQASRLQLFATPNFQLPFLLADSSFVL